VPVSVLCDYANMWSAGTTDSVLTNHGFLQATRLGIHLATAGIKVAHIFSSDLQRAVCTAGAIRDAQSPTPPETTRLALLREQDFGFYEGKRVIPRGPSGKSGKAEHAEAHSLDPGFKGVESKESMKLRMETFVDTHLVQLLHEVPSDHSVVVVAHGIILSYLWKSILACFPRCNVSITPHIQASERDFSLEYLGSWSNTGYLELEITSTVTSEFNPPGSRPKAACRSKFKDFDPSQREYLKATPTLCEAAAADLPRKAADVTADVAPTTRKLLRLSMAVKAVNSQQHLKGLKKTRGGLGSLKHDLAQKTVDSFFKKRRVE
jgi:broad specificity phosphatase PhoE